MDTLLFVPDNEPVRSVKPRINKAQYGDGYAQRTPNGINHQLETWKLSHDLKKAAEIDYLKNFLDTQGGYKAFLWQPPGSLVAKKFICEEGYDETFDYADQIKTLAFTLVEVP